ELVESPRFADYAGEAEVDGARYMLGTALHELGAEESARRYLRAVLDKGPEASYFAPAFRRHTDVALAGLPLGNVIEELGKLALALPEDAQNELRYLRGREREAAGDDELALRAYAEITKHSRFYANAQYLLGAIASRRGQFAKAERQFCKIASAGDQDRYSFYVDQRYFAVKDLARLGLGRVAHEQGRADDAFYYYFQVPQDSARLPEAMFEAAYATYEGGDHDTALDLLDQLQARFPRSAFADEASLLRGYVALSACDFDKASKLFSLFIERFTPVLAETERILKSPSRRDALYADLARAQAGASDVSAVRQSLLALIGVDPVFQDLHERVRMLDAESARAARLPDVLGSLAARLSGSDAPRAAADPTQLQREQLRQLQRELESARQAVGLLTQQVDTMRKLGAPAAQLLPLEKDLVRIENRLALVQGHAQDARLSLSPAAIAQPQDAEVAALFARDLELAQHFDERVVQLRPKLVAAANARALAGLTALRTRLADFLRRARIGRIDAVMGSKRRIEIQIESLAAGRFPAELRDPLLVQGFLGDDEEFWPFEGEDWPDEYLERYAPASAAQAKPAESEALP
ncbi:MAG TPA: tetratricopeptide repeat protein, partial [Polyangiales bacterium]